MPRYARIRELLAHEDFPHSFTFKFVGKSTAVFEAGLIAFEAQFPSLLKQARKPSSKGNHVAMTYLLRADSPDEIIEVYRQVAILPDILIVL